MRQFLEKNGDRLHFCLFFEWTMMSSFFSWTMGIHYYSSHFVKTIQVADLSRRAHLCQGWLQTHTHRHKHCQPESQGASAIQVDSVPCFPSLPILPPARTAPVFPCPSLMHNTIQNPIAVLPLHLSVSTPSQGLCNVYSCISTLPKDTGVYSMLFCLLLVLLLCPSSMLSSVVVHLRHSVELLPPEGVVLLPPEPFSLALLLSSPLVSQSKRGVFSWINKLDQLSKWFDVV